MGPGDFDEFYETEMYLGPRYVTPSMLNIELKIPGGRTAELALFRALLSYEEGLPALIVLGDGAILHGGESLEAGATTPEGFKGNVFFLAGNDTDEIVRAFNEPDCDWPEMLEVGRQNFMERGKPPSKSYVAWLKHEIAKREDDETKAA